MNYWIAVVAAAINTMILAVPDVKETVAGAESITRLSAQYPMIIALFATFAVAAGALYVASLVIKSMSKTTKDLTEGVDKKIERLASAVDVDTKATEAFGKKVEGIGHDVESLKSRMDRAEDKLGDIDKGIDELLDRIPANTRKAG